MVRGQGCCSISCNGQDSPHNNYLIQYVNITEFENPCLKIFHSLKSGRQAGYYVNGIIIIVSTKIGAYGKHTKDAYFPWRSLRVLRKWYWAEKGKKGQEKTFQREAKEKTFQREEIAWAKSWNHNTKDLISLTKLEFKVVGMEPCEA